MVAVSGWETAWNEEERGKLARAIVGLIEELSVRRAWIKIGDGGDWEPLTPEVLSELRLRLLPLWTRPGQGSDLFDELTDNRVYVAWIEGDPPLLRLFYVDWSRIEDRIFFTPRVALWTYPPESERYGPPERGWGPSAVDPREFGKEVTQRFLPSILQIYIDKGGGRNVPELLGEVRETPLIFITFMEDAPVEEVLEALSSEGPVGSAARTLLLTPDPLSYDVTGGILEACMVVLRREVRLEPRELRIPGARKEVSVPIFFAVAFGRPIRELERTGMYTADKLIYLENDLDRSIMKLAADLANLRRRVSLIGGIVDDLAEYLRDLMELFPRLDPEVRSLAWRSLEETHLNVEVMTPEMHRVLTKAKGLDERFNAIKKDHIIAFSKFITYRPLEVSLRGHAVRVRDLSEGPFLDAAYFALRDLCTSVESKTRDVEGLVDGVTRILSGLLSERRVEQDRRMGRALNVIGFILGLLTVVTAAVGLLGEVGLEDVVRALETLPAPFSLISFIPENWPYLLFFAYGFSLGVLAILVGFGLWMAKGWIAGRVSPLARVLPLPQLGRERGPPEYFALHHRWWEMLHTAGRSPELIRSLGEIDVRMSRILKEAVERYVECKRRLSRARRSGDLRAMARALSDLIRFGTRVDTMSLLLIEEAPPLTSCAIYAVAPYGKSPLLLLEELIHRVEFVRGELGLSEPDERRIVRVLMGWRGPDAKDGRRDIEDRLNEFEERVEALRKLIYGT